MPSGLGATPGIGLQSTGWWLQRLRLDLFELLDELLDVEVPTSIAQLGRVAAKESEHRFRDFAVGGHRGTLDQDWHDPNIATECRRDFEADKINIIVETKGYFYDSARDRQKLCLVKEQHPELDIRIVFQKADTKIHKTSKTTYGEWATDHNFKWADKGIVPDEWIEEMKKGTANGSKCKPHRSKRRR